MKENNLDQDDLSRKMILDLFYKTKGDLDKINKAIDEKLAPSGYRKISLFEEFIKNRIVINPRILKMSQMEISAVETIYLSQYPAINEIEVLDLRKNFIGDLGAEALAQSSFLNNLRELDLRNNGISRLGVKVLSESNNLSCLERIDLRLNKLGKSWEKKFFETGNFQKLSQIKTI